MGKSPAKKAAPAPGPWTIRRDVDPIAVVALLLSSIAVGSQLVAWLQGPSVKLIPPERVVLYRQTSPDGTAIVRIGAPVSYANVASQSYGALILKETATVSVGSLKSEQEWNAFGTIDGSGGVISVRYTDIALPVALPGQTSVSHITLFTPLRKRCAASERACKPTENYVSPEQFAAAVAKADRIRFTFKVKLSDGPELSSSCEVLMGPVNKPQLANLASQVFYGICYPIEA
jgi:hypothetical protein